MNKVSVISLLLSTLLVVPWATEAGPVGKGPRRLPPTCGRSTLVNMGLDAHWAWLEWAKAYPELEKSQILSEELIWTQDEKRTERFQTNPRFFGVEAQSNWRVKVANGLIQVEFEFDKKDRSDLIRPSLEGILARRGGSLEGNGDPRHSFSLSAANGKIAIEEVYRLFESASYRADLLNTGGLLILRISNRTLNPDLPYQLAEIGLLASAHDLNCEAIRSFRWSKPNEQAGLYQAEPRHFGLSGDSLWYANVTASRNVTMGFQFADEDRAFGELIMPSIEAIAQSAGNAIGTITATGIMYTFPPTIDPDVRIRALNALNVLFMSYMGPTNSK